MGYTTYFDDEVSMLRHNSTVVVHQKISNKYFQVRLTPTLAELAWVPYTSRVGKMRITIFATFSLATLLSAAYYLFVGPLTTTLRSDYLPMLIGFFIVNIILHELGHMTALYCCGGRPEKVGLKLNYGILPSVYVRMNRTLLMSKLERATCYGAGILVNATIVTCAHIGVNFGFLGQEWSLASRAVTVFMLFNCIPLFNTDGQKLFSLIMHTEQSKSWSDQPIAYRLMTILSYLTLCIMAIVTGYTLLNLISTR